MEGDRTESEGAAPGLPPASESRRPWAKGSDAGLPPGTPAKDTRPAEEGSCVLEPQGSLPLPQRHVQACGWHIPFQEEARSSSHPDKPLCRQGHHLQTEGTAVKHSGGQTARLACRGENLGRQEMGSAVLGPRRRRGHWTIKFS